MTFFDTAEAYGAENEELVGEAQNPFRKEVVIATKFGFKDGNANSGQDIVYINLVGNLETMGNNIVKAMQENKVKRIIAISSIGIYETPLKSVLVPYRKLAVLVENSGLDYTILRPDWFTDDNEIDYGITHKGNAETGSPISRKSIASFISSVIENPDFHKNENLGISKPN